MTQEQARDLLQQGIVAARENRQEEARGLLQQAVRLDPQNETIWLWLSSVATNNKERVFCLKQILSINPQNEYAHKGLEALGAVSVEPEEPLSVEKSSVPLLDDAKLARAQQSADDFFREFLRRPPTRADVSWTHKTHRRYGEGGAQRLQRVTYAAAGIVVVVVGALAVVLASSLGVFDGSTGDDVALGPLQAATATATPTMTPTPGGPTPTPFAAPDNLFSTEVPSNLERGSVYGNPATPVYPALHPNVAGRIETAIDLYGAGRYEDALALFESENEASGQHCYPEVYYYQAMSLVELGDYDFAEDLLEDARTDSRGGGGFSSCTNKPLILAGLGYINYLNGDLGSATTYSQQALDADPDLVQPSVTLALILLQQGATDQARSVLEPSLVDNPGDVNLLIAAVKVELADEDYGRALYFLGRALYVEPASQIVLTLQAEVYLDLAGATESDVQRLAYYGLAVQSAQTLLLYYSGDPRGQVLLAQARLGEGNADMAEQALSRVIQVGASLPENDESVVASAYQLRGQLYYGQGRLEEAKSDLLIALDFDAATSEQALFALADISVKQGAYGEALDYVKNLRRLNSGHATYVLLEARLSVELCSLSSGVSCDYEEMVDVLGSPDLLARLTSSQRADALSYRAQARYHVASDRQSLSDVQRLSAYQEALGDVNEALSSRQRVIDHYYRGLLFAALGLPSEALDELEWVSYWQSEYDYPFIQGDLRQRIEDLEAILVEQGDSGEVTGTQEVLQPADATPSADRPDATPALAPVLP